MTKLQIPKLSLVVLIGTSGSGKSTFAQKHFLPTEVISSDYCRGLVSDDTNDQTATNDAFELLHFVAGKRLALGKLVVIDATNVQAEARLPLVRLAKEYHCFPVAIVLNLDEDLCHERNRDRPDRRFGAHVVRQQKSQLKRSLRFLKHEGFRYIYVLNDPTEVDRATIERTPLWNDRREEHGPFDIIGDVHGCADELEELLAKLGYELAPRGVSSDDSWGEYFYRHPQGRRAIFVGDLVDRGPRVLDCVRIARNMVEQGTAMCVPGNHEMKLLRKLSGRDVKVSHGLAESLAQIEQLDEQVRPAFVQEMTAFMDRLVSHYVLDDGKLVVAHAGLKKEMHGRGSGKVREFCLYGDTTGESDEFGLPIRLKWAKDYRGTAMVVYGHTPVVEPEWLNGTVNIDTGCVFGGKLTALRYPEKQTVSVPAKRMYCEPRRPIADPATTPSTLTTQQEYDDVLDAADVLGKRIIATRLHRNVTVREENGTAAFEVMSRFAANPKWLIYLPPTMSPCATSSEAGMLEHPAEAFGYFCQEGVAQVVCEEKHMGSRAVAIVCRDEAAARSTFGVIENEAGIIYTRTGRRFFSDSAMEIALLDRLRQAMTASGFWDKFQTTWACLDCELMPWSAKAQELLRNDYAAIGAAGNAALPSTLASIAVAMERLDGPARETLQGLQSQFASRRENVTRFVNSYRNYCWPVQSVEDLKLAPFHLLATEGYVHSGQTNVWHMETLAEICRHDPQVLLATPYKVVDIDDPQSEAEGIAWWQSLVAKGGEGMVVKPLSFVATNGSETIQPAVKCRGPEYLRIIYGPDYSDEQNLARLRRRGLGRKRSLALREFALGVEALERFVRREPLRRVHECVFGVLALESEPVDPRL